VWKEIKREVPNAQALRLQAREKRHQHYRDFETAHFQRESGPVDKQPDHNLWVHPTLLGAANPPQCIFFVGLEIQGLPPNPLCG
jgi:hypothetical protein